MALIMAFCCIGFTAFAASDPIAEASNSVVFIQSQFWAYYSFGSGFAVGEKGKPVEYIVTNAHVVHDDTTGQTSDYVTVYFNVMANKYMVAEVYYLDVSKDICVLKLPEPTSERQALLLGKADEVSTGSTVYALGYPDYGTVGQNYNKFDTSDIVVTKGIISKITRADMSLADSVSSANTNVFMTDAAISSGNSGGPMINENGALIGINTATTTNAASSTAHSGFAVTVSELIPALNSAGASYQFYDKVAQGIENDAVLIIIIAAAAVICVVVIVVITSKNKKSKNNIAAQIQQQQFQQLQQQQLQQQQQQQQQLQQQPVGILSNEAVVIGISGRFAGSTFAVGGRVVIGRNPEKCTVCYPVDTKGISGVHCEIRKTPNGFEIVDCGSSNGTFLGSGQKLQPNVPVIIPNGTYFYLASREQMFQIKNV